MSLRPDQSETYWALDRLGRVQLSRHFCMRQFLHSEIAVITGINNTPDDPDLAIETGSRLCAEILEPLIVHYGPIVIRSGFRSAKLNDYGHQHGLQCAANIRNFAYHIWDHVDASGHQGAAACIIIPSVRDAPDQRAALEDLIGFIRSNLDFHRLTFFRRDTAFNIGWHEEPSRVVKRAQ